jgi:hypothetical protein
MQCKEGEFVEKSRAASLLRGGAFFAYLPSRLCDEPCATHKFSIEHM